VDSDSSSARRWASWLLALTSLLALGAQEFPDNLTLAIVGPVAQRLLPCIFAIRLAIRFAAVPGWLLALRLRLVDLVLMAGLLMTLRSPDLAAYLVLMSYGLNWLYEPIAATREARALPASPLRLQPAGLLVASFAGVSLVGALLLTLPLATQSGQSTSFIDALFTATSATCVTGLVVLDTPTHFSLFGQAIILLLIQIGGLGIMTLSTAGAFLLGRRMGVRQRMVMQEVLDSADSEELRKSLVAIVRGTLLIEAAGLLVLSARFAWRGEDLVNSLWLGLFHSVSAFCNAGFALFSDSLLGFKGDAAILLTISTLVFFGGLGFTVMGELAAYPRARRLGLHTRLVLVTTCLLLVVGTIFFYFSEVNSSMKGYSPTERVLSAWFASVTPRTAGFNTVPMAALSQAGILLTMVLMFIGACAGSTGGGIKTSTFAVMVLAIRALAAGKACVVFGRTIPATTVSKAFSITSVSLCLTMLITLGLTWTESAPLHTVMFEAISAFGTVGLSLDFTPQLSKLGRLLISLLMFAGRVGPLTLALALGSARGGGDIEYPEGRVMVG
jgi:trk system potassium uptake protein TrkH